MDITALLARTAKIDGAPADNRSAGDGPAFNRTLAAAIANAGNTADNAAVPPAAIIDAAAAEQRPRSEKTPPAISGDLPLESPLQSAASEAGQLPEQIAENISGEMDTDLSTDTGDATSPAPLFAASSDGTRPAPPVTAVNAPQAPPATAATRLAPAQADSAGRQTREQPGAAAPSSSTAIADAAGALNSAATEPPRAAVAAAADGDSVIENNNIVGRSLAAAAETSAPAPAAAAAPSTPGTATATIVAAPSQGSLPSPLASGAWQQELGQQLQGMVQRGDGSVELHLNPRELGPLSVNLQLDDQGARAQFLSAHAGVRSAVEQAVPQLREALAEQGISLGEASVGEQRQESGRDDSGSGRPGAGGGALVSSDPETATKTAPAGAAVASGRVDLYA